MNWWRRFLKRLQSVSFRLNAFFVSIGIILSIAAGRALLLQGIDASAYAQAAAEQLTRTQVLKADRGLILDRNGQRLAETQPAFVVVADPYAISTNGMDPAAMDADDWAKAKKAPREIAKIVVRYLGGSVADYLPKLAAKRTPDGAPNQYEVLKRQVSAAIYQDMAQELKNGGWYGIYPQPDPVRYYPNGELAANVLGFVNGEGVGASGLEYGQNDLLQGTDGTQSYQTAAYGVIPLGDNTLVEPVNGATMQLTIDAEMQWMAETELAHAVQEHKAKSGTAVVMAVQTGEILALATNPSFNPNQPGEAEPENLGNRAVSDAYEPGSVQKVLTAAALLDAGLITPDTPVQVPNSIASGGYQIRDAWSHDTLYLTARGVVAHSSNVGTVLLARQMDKAQLSRYLASFGLGESTGIELPGETGGAMGLLPGTDMADYTQDQIAFGQGLSVTAIQEAAAVAAVTNGGIYHRPTVLRSIVTADGQDVELPADEPRRVISQAASNDVVNMMEASVASPEMVTNDAQPIPGYRMAGKSGTAEKIGEFGSYDGGHIGSYVAVAPVENPQILVYVVIDEPTRGGYYGGVVAYPAANEIMRQALPRYGIAPNEQILPFTDPLSYQP